MKPAALCLLLVACQPALDDQAQAIVNGTLDGSDVAVVAIVPRRTRCEDSGEPIQCTGTLIAPRVVLTAAHCVQPGAGQGTLEVFVGAPVGDPAGQYILVDDAVRHPMFDDATHAYDLALLRLAEPATAAPVALPTTMLDGSAAGSAARIVGYGVTQTGTIADGNRREATMTISAVDALTFTATPAPGNSCGGDSGGPVFVAGSGGEQLLGVTSSGDGRCEVDAIDARVDVAVADFIQPFLAAAPPGGGAIALDAVCTSPCGSAADCPAAMTCLPDEHGAGRCQIAGGIPGDLGSACTTDTQCRGSGGCARVTPSDCRCLAACGTAPPPGGSCAAAGDPAWLAGLAGLGVIGIRRRRSARRTPV